MTMSDRNCICDHDLIWHDFKGRCNWREYMGFQCNCHGFRRTVPAIIEGVDEGDILGALRRIELAINNLGAALGDDE
jgi:hypothetical protein